jgi:hypothetical protein
MSGAFRSGVLGGLMGFIMSVLASYYLVPMPTTLGGIAVGNGISGLISGFMGGFMGVLIDSAQRRRSVRSP